MDLLHERKVRSITTHSRHLEPHLQLIQYLIHSGALNFERAFMPNYRPPPIKLTARTRLNPLPNSFGISSMRNSNKSPEYLYTLHNRSKLSTEEVLITELNYPEEKSIEDGSNIYDSRVNLQEKYASPPLLSKPTKTETSKVRHASLGNSNVIEDSHYTLNAFKYPDNTLIKPKLNQFSYHSKLKERTKHRSIEVPYQSNEPTPDSQYDVSNETPMMIHAKDHNRILDRPLDSFHMVNASPVYDNIQIQMIGLNYKPLTKVKIFDRKKADKLKLMQHNSFSKPSNHIIHTEVHTDAATQTAFKNAARESKSLVVNLKRSSRWNSESPEIYSKHTSMAYPSKLSTIAIVHQ